MSMRTNCWRKAGLAICLGAATMAYGPGASAGQDGAAGGPRIIVTSVMVDDQEKALQFYTEVLGFVKKRDDPVGDARWLTVVSPADPDGVELLLEPNTNPASRTFQQAIFDQGIPATMFGVDDVRREYDRLRALGVEFRTGPTQMGGAMTVVLDDTCGNLIMLAELLAGR